MSASLVILLPLLLGGLALVVALVVAVVALAGSRSPAATLPATAAAARRHGAAVTAIAWALALLTFVVLGPVLAAALAATAEGIGFGLMPALAGAAFLGTHAIGEMTWPRPSGSVRRATLTRRTVADVSPALLRRALWAWVALVVTLGLIGSLTAADDGRSVTRTVVDGAASSGPYPGAFYAVPLAVAAVLVVIATEAVLRLVAGRPAVVDTAPEWDLQLRRLSAHRVLRGSQLVLGLTAAGMLLVAGMSLSNVAQAFAAEGAGSAGSTPHAVAAWVCLALAAVTAIGAFVLTVLPAEAPRFPAARWTSEGLTPAPAGDGVAPLPPDASGAPGPAQPSGPARGHA